jgi:DUF1680 family protein
MGAPFIASLPQYIYSVAADGIYVNLYAASRITTTVAGSECALSMETEFPLNSRVRLTVEAPGTFVLRLRIPGWATRAVAITCNGQPLADGEPGTYVELARDWSCGDTVELDLNSEITVHRYCGWDQSADYRRYSLHYGPILLCLVNATHFNVQSRNIVERLVPIEGQPLHYSVRTEGPDESMPDDARVMPYWLVAEDQPFTAYPTTGRFQSDGTGKREERKA